LLADAAAALLDAALDAFEDELLLGAAVLELLAALLLATLLLELLLLETLDAAEELVVVFAYEHQAESLNALPPLNSLLLQVKLPLSVAYTKLPDLPRATLRVPLMLQLLPT
jgi:hypothetical protein